MELLNEKSKIIIVTGGSRGIGRGIVERLSNSGYTVILNYNESEKEALDIQKKLKKQNIEIDIYKADVSKREQVIKLIKFVIEKYGKIDVLINNAGIDQVKMFTDITDEDWNSIINTNLTSVFYVTQETVKSMINRKQGCIINISSIWGIIGASCESHYAISKAGIDAMTKSLAKELGPSNIRINSIAPGIIDTDMNKNLTENELNSIKDEIPLEKIGRPDDIAKCVEWLINDTYTTGQIISINGGWNIN